ncbi:MAG: PAS domain-containing protein [Candidatus Binatia bacterium]
MAVKNVNDKFLSQLMGQTPAIRTVLNLVPSPLIFWRSDRSLCILNQRVKHLTGLSDDQLQENPSLWMNRIHPRDLSLYVAAWKKLQNGENMVSCDYRFSTAYADKEIWLRDESVPYQNPRGKVEGVISTYTDISDLKAGRLRKEKEEKAVGVAGIMDGAIHEIQNNLQVINLGLGLIQVGKSESPHTANLSISVGRIQNMLQDTYEYLVPPDSRSSAVNPENVLEEVIRSKENELRDQGVPIRLVCPGPLPVVRIDLTQFRMTLERVIEFSRALLPHGGKLEIEAGLTQIDSEQYVELKIASISPTPIEVEEKDVFQPFLRVHRHQAGLSMPLARDIINRHQGKISFRMENPKQGLFVILLKVR